MAKDFTALRIDENILNKIDSMAKQSGRSRSNMIRFILIKYLESHEII